MKALFQNLIAQLLGRELMGSLIRIEMAYFGSCLKKYDFELNFVFKKVECYKNNLSNV